MTTAFAIGVPFLAAGAGLSFVRWMFSSAELGAPRRDRGYMDTLLICTALILGASVLVCVCFLSLIGEIRLLPDRIWERFQMGHQPDAARSKRAPLESVG